MYKAKDHYQRPDVVRNYEGQRFASWHGRMAHQIESRAMKYVLRHYFRPGGTVLDLPCGTGRLLRCYSGGDFRIVGADISQTMLTVARGRFQGNPLFSFQRCEAEALPFPANAFDYLVSFRFMPHLPANIRRTVLREMIRVTRDVLAVNYYFAVCSPLALFNRLFRKSACPPHPVSEIDFKSEIRDMKVELCEIRKLSWYERASALVIMKKI
jgi:SAM-dependent methyltransferase